MKTRRTLNLLAALTILAPISGGFPASAPDHTTASAPQGADAIAVESLEAGESLAQARTPFWAKNINRYRKAC